MKQFVGKVMTKEVPFLGEKVKIKKLSAEIVLAIQAKAKEVAASQDDNANIEMLLFVIKSGVDGAEDLTSDQIKGFPLDELSSVSDAILVFSGLGNVAK